MEKNNETQFLRKKEQEEQEQEQEQEEQKTPAQEFRKKSRRSPSSKGKSSHTPTSRVSYVASGQVVFKDPS